MRFLILFFALTLAGCGSTPYRDDYTKHVNLLATNYFNDTSFKFSFVKNQSVDLRGLYSQYDTVSASPVMYQGGGGLVGMLAQIGAHSSIIQSQRSDILAKEQEKANMPILPLINISKNMSLIELLENNHSLNFTLDSEASNTINIKPIFFSNSDMTEFSLTSIVWLLDKKKGKRRKQKYQYKNLIRVYSQKLNEAQRKKLANGDNRLLSNVLSSLLNTALFITKNELTGLYARVNNPMQTFIIKNDSGTKVIRGSIVAEKCGYQIIQDLHSWFIAYPKPESSGSLNGDNRINIKTCKDS